MMHTHTILSLLLPATCLLSIQWASAENAAPIEATLTVHADQPGAVISPTIYGQFAEHLGRCIYEGVWVGPESPIPNTRGIRNDVVAALKDLGVPVLRWPGGCFADEYHWRDGIGPRDKRPKRINTHWGGVIETNQFGTHEFMDLCEQIGAEPYICGNVGSGTVQEMMDWVEYMTSDADSTLANERRANGREKPWKLPYFGVGNESWGCGGNMTPEFYADEFKRYQTFVKNFSGNRITKIACGSNAEDYNWTDVLMSRAAKQMQGLSLHYYTLPTGNWSDKGSATNFTEEDWAATMARTLRMEELVSKHSAIMDKYDPQKKVGMVIDEWGAWYDAEPGMNPGFLYQQNTLRDAIVAAVNLDIFHAHADRVKMTCIAQMINVLQAMILTDKEKMVLTPTYYVMQMYRVHQGATFIPADVDAPAYKIADTSIPSLHATASLDGSGVLHISLVNLDPNRPADVTLKVSGGRINGLAGTILTSGQMNAMNTFDHPDAVKPSDFNDFHTSDKDATFTIPAKSVLVIRTQN
jgi:alpha-N-arabinofuranosidase